MTPEIELANQLCFSIYNANRLFNKFYVEALAPFKLTYAQYLVLMALWEHDDQSLHELGTVLRLSSNTLPVGYGGSAQPMTAANSLFI